MSRLRGRATVASSAERLVSSAPVDETTVKEVQELVRVLRKQVQIGDFGPELPESVERVQRILPSLKKLDELLYFEALGIVVEELDYYGRYKEARNALSEDAIKILAELPNWQVPKDEEERRHLKVLI